MNNKNRHGNDFVICINCEVSHVENCTTCFGWGFFKDGGVVNAGYAYEFNQSEEEFSSEKFESCLECGSDIRGTDV